MNGPTDRPWTIGDLRTYSQNRITVKQADYRQTVENTYWIFFIEWLRGTSFNSSNGESIDTLFWYWYINNIKMPDVNLAVKITLAPKK